MSPNDSYINLKWRLSKSKWKKRNQNQRERTQYLQTIVIVDHFFVCDTQHLARIRSNISGFATFQKRVTCVALKAC